MFQKQDMMRLLHDATELFPICIPSYKRWSRNDNKTMVKIIEQSDQEVQDKTFLFVRKEQEEQYRKNYPKTNIIVLPKVRGLASTRQFIEDFMYQVLKQPYFLDIDDDITSLGAVVIENGKPCVTKVGETKPGEVLRLFCEISRVAFERDGCVLGKPRRAHFANNMEYTQTAYVTNKGATPRSVTAINAKGLRELGVRRNMMFDPTGDDVGFVAEICKKKGSMFNAECLIYAYVDDEINSVIRNDKNRRQLAAYEYECLKKYPMKDYLRIPFKFEDGSYKFSDIDFTKYRQIAGVESRRMSLQEFEGIMRCGG